MRVRRGLTAHSRRWWPRSSRIIWRGTILHGKQAGLPRRGGRRLGSIFCVAQSADVAKLRLFLLEPEARGRGLGQRMLGHCMDFARAKGYAGMTLATHESHRAACALYARNGWRIAQARPVRAYGCDLLEQTWDIAFH